MCTAASRPTRNYRPVILAASLTALSKRILPAIAAAELAVESGVVRPQLQVPLHMV
jgi:hypothetical protein